ncbi:MAG: U32 family peptidase [Clostridiales bacterium]|nr:U32 family peptidase [Clostridiales bacterium]
MMELLSPAGGQEAVIAAVRSGADAVYLGSGNFNARRGAANFDDDALREAVDFCHLRGVKVYLTLNTLLGDGELEEAARLAAYASALGIDAVLVQDLGVAAVVRRVAPDLPLHASTQMTVHSLDGVRAAADLGMTRVVLSRELSRDAIAHICAHSPVEIEVFVHGALCMCYSGQCFLSSVIGGRSGNRGMCAQPCRQPYGWGNRAEGYPLSLKDMSLVGHLQELEDMGVACAKIEGRMKRPEYVAIVTRICAAALKEKRSPTREELEQLRLAFSRQWCADGYFQGRAGPEMFRGRAKAPLPELRFAEARKGYQREVPLVPVRLSARVEAGKPVAVTAEDRDGHCAAVTAPPPEAALHRPVTAEQLEGQLAKTGGTPYFCQAVRAEVEEGLSLPVSRMNALRREALDALSRQRVAPPERRTGAYTPCSRIENGRSPCRFTLSCARAEQVTEELLALHPALVALDLEAMLRAKSQVGRMQALGIIPAVTLPRILWDREREGCLNRLTTLRRWGVDTAYVSTLAGMELAREAGFPVVRGDFGLGVYNSETLSELKGLGFASAVLSFEQRRERVRDLAKCLDTELLVYGRLPLMITENCIVKNRTGKCTEGCKQAPSLVDRKRMRFPVVRAYGCRNEILNAVPLFLADKPETYAHVGLWAARLRFTTETGTECARMLARYLGQNDDMPQAYTRGLYFREVE